MLTPLSRRLDAWVKNGLISSAQALSITEFESRTGRSWVSFGIVGIVGIGVTAIATGVISLIAANWENIPPWLKLINYFLLQAGAGYLFLRNEKKEGVWREGCLALFLLLFLAGIGLFAQVFNLEGDGWSAFAFWLTLVLPGVALGRHPLFAYAWTAVLEVTACWWMSSGGYWGREGWRGENFRQMAMVSLPLWLTALSFWTQAAAVLSAQFKNAFTVLGIGTFALFGTVFGNLMWDAGYFHKYNSDELRFLWIPWLALLIAMGGSLARKQTSWNVRRVTAGFLFLIGIYLTIPLLTDIDFQSRLLRQIIGASGFIGIAAVGAYLAAIDEQKRLYNIATQLIALRFIVIYFQVFGSLAQTGVGLIVSGLVILGIAYFWNRIKKTLFAALTKKGNNP